MTRFAVASLGRSGSTLLCHLLDSHPDARCLGEALAPQADWRAAGSALTLAEHLAAHVYLDDRPAIGFKMMHEHAVELPEAWDALEALGVRLVVNRRRNKVDQYLSMVLARRWDAWSSSERYPATTVRVDPDDLLRRAREWTIHDAGLEALASRFPAIGVAYEDVRRGVGLDAVQRFLGLEPAALRTPTVRARQQLRRETIANFDELAEALAPTPWGGDLFAPE